MLKKIQVAIIEDHALMRQGVINLLKEEEDIEVIFDACNGEEMLRVLETRQPDIILLDIEMPVMNGRQALEVLNEKYPGIKVIMLTMHFSDLFITEMFARGASAFLQKNCDVEKLLETIRIVFEEGYHFGPAISKALIAKLMADSRLKNFEKEPTLSPREIDILRLVCLEKSNQEIGEQLLVSKRTVEWHKNNILLKTKSKNIVGLVKYAIKHNIIMNDPEIQAY